MRSVPFARAAMVAMAVPAGAEAADPAVAPVQALDDGLIAIMKAGKAAGVKGRASRIAPVIDRTFDLPLMTRLAVGSAWNGIAPADQKALVAAFRRLTIAQYADNFDGGSGHSLSIDPNVQARGSVRLVRTTLKSPGEAPVAIAYRLRQDGGAWKIIDVFY
jgi:phospholipid transport system substrate-binding protein